MEGRWSIDEGSLIDLLTLFMNNMQVEQPLFDVKFNDVTILYDS